MSGSYLLLSDKHLSTINNCVLQQPKARKKHFSTSLRARNYPLAQSNTKQKLQVLLLIEGLVICAFLMGLPPPFHKLRAVTDEANAGQWCSTALL